MNLVLALDQGTTATKAHLYAPGGRFETIRTLEHRQILPHAGWVEHDPDELIGNLKICLDGVAGRADVAALGIANQGETVIAWNRDTGRPLGNAIVWQDTRTQEAIERLRATGAEALTKVRAGLPLDPYFSAAKLRWLLDHGEGARALLASGRLGLGTSDSFFLDRLAGIYATDVTTASRTSLMNLATGSWDGELCRLFGVPKEALPEIRPTIGPLAEIRLGHRHVPITASVVDQQAALFGHGCHRPGRAKITFGTGAFALAVTGATPLGPEAGNLLPTVAWQRSGENPVFAVDGGVYNAASALNWARGLGLFEAFGDIDEFDGPRAIERGLVFVPALSGLGCPYWDRSAAGLWIGMGLETSRADMVRSVMEGVALRAAELISEMDKVARLEAVVSIDGGLSKNGYFRGFLADALGREVVVPATPELTGLGTGQMAAVGAGLVAIDDPALVPAPRLKVQPARPLDDRLLARFAEAVQRSRAWR